MPNWTLGKIMSTATTWAGYRSDVSASDVSFYANQAILDFNRDMDGFLDSAETIYSVSSGDSLLTLPADFDEPKSLSQLSTEASGNFAIPMVAPERADSEGYYPVGAPQGYFIDEDKIQLWPSASSSANSTASSGRSLIFRYRAMPTDLTSTSSVPSVHTNQRIALVWKTMQYIHMHTGNIEESVVAEAQYTQMLASFKDAAAKKHSERRGFKIALKDRSSRRLDGDIRDQTDEWLRR